jgi:hypothetical protein
LSPRLRSLVRRYGPWLLAALGLGLVPWALLLAYYLPSRKVAEHWDLAWVGFDIVLATLLIATAIAFIRKLPFRGSLAAATGALLVADAWFDVVTAGTGKERAFAVVLAVLGELPLATICFILARPEQEG